VAFVVSLDAGGQGIPTRRPRLEVAAVTIGAPDPRALAAFYSHLLGWEVANEEGPAPGAPAEDGWAQLRSPPGEPRFSLNFEFEPHYEPPVWPSEPGRQEIMEHLDIWVEDLDGAVNWAVQAGATEAAYQPQQGVRVMLDPAGHPFCLFTG
jgi:catechol 2,3-dioxygenase-like lactoylglutathione lyase family enzyme